MEIHLPLDSPKLRRPLDIYMSILVRLTALTLGLFLLPSITHAKNIIRTPAPISYSAPAVVEPEAPSGYRYWRLFIAANNGDAYYSIGELELRAQPGGADLTTPSTPTTESSLYSPGYSGSRVVDNGSQYWISDGYPNAQSLEFDLVNPTVVREIAIYPNPQAGNYQTRAPRDFRIEASTDKQSWTVIKQYQGVTTWNYETWKVFSFE